eukprot:CAMPEP_0171610594 /NCGR_PEP_ID=MMETSP0990-20121206/10143_1 /TAXON_ID=483369 /ORGANISM="non described non described, Strain CCMP2098" /LENGTH=152 /DNA_ID=CAMNT_0012174035 /DNA_START=148 /DNA_END=606 /DNA_ORIENTATION=+
MTFDALGRAVGMTLCEYLTEITANQKLRSRSSGVQLNRDITATSSSLASAGFSTDMQGLFYKVAEASTLLSLSDDQVSTLLSVLPSDIATDGTAFAHLEAMLAACGVCRGVTAFSPQKREREGNGNKHLNICPGREWHCRITGLKKMENIAR